MATNSELVRPSSLPRTLEMRVATGRAAEAIAIFLATNSLPEDAPHNLKWAAEMLRLTADHPLRAGRSIGAYRRDVSLLAAAKRADTNAQLKDVAAKLTSTCKTLERLAAGRHVATAQAQSAFELLETIRSSAAAHRSSSPERIIRVRPRS
jgi:hypothetical protein